ncbi:MAG: Hemin-binding periplasmic protein HmuT [Candidatus Erwinia impunctatus]|nr:Hemin-binding periplasmic protein HmuT [Culicoides impunctatus]
MKKWLMVLLAFPLSLFASERVVSIGGDLTEIVYALDAEQNLIARDSTSLQPPEVLKLPDVGYMRQLNAEGIMAMNPSLVISSDLAKPSLVLEQLKKAGIPVVMVTGKPSLEAIHEKIVTVALAVNRKAQGEQLADKIDKQIAAIATTPLNVRVLYLANRSGNRMMGAGSDTAANGVIIGAGLQNAMGNVPHYQPLTQEGLVASAPQLIVIGQEGLRSIGGEENLWKLPGLSLTPAAKNRNVLVINEMALLGFGLETPAAMQKLRHAAEATQ